jgi:hypothetical protein
MLRRDSARARSFDGAAHVGSRVILLDPSALLVADDGAADIYCLAKWLGGLRVRPESVGLASPGSRSRRWRSCGSPCSGPSAADTTETNHEHSTRLFALSRDASRRRDDGEHLFDRFN